MLMTEDHVIIDTYDRVTQSCVSHHYRTDADGNARYSAGNFRYLWPAECDLMAQLAGMELDGALRRLGRQPVHRGQREPCLGLAQALTTGHAYLPRAGRKRLETCTPCR